MYYRFGDDVSKLDSIVFARDRALPTARALLAGNYRWGTVVLAKVPHTIIEVEVSRACYYYLPAYPASPRDAAGHPRSLPPHVVVANLPGDNFVEVQLSHLCRDESVAKRYLDLEYEIARRRREAIEDPENCCGGRGNNCPC